MCHQLHVLTSEVGLKTVCKVIFPDRNEGKREIVIIIVSAQPLILFVRQEGTEVEVWGEGE